MADAELLRIVVQNLLLNSAHAVQERGAIDVSLTSGGGACQVAIADNGPGIPPTIREKLFTPFFTTKGHGTGLGLATAKRLVEAHGGAITIDCPPHGGTVVTVRPPADAA
jgi:two-component system NtrC family sensor kinase